MNDRFAKISEIGSGSIKVYNVETYGAVHDGVTDDTAAIQAAINAVHSFGGGIVYFPNGVYNIAGAFTMGVQISIPKDEYLESQTLTRIKLLGEVAPNMFSDPLNGGLPPETGAVLKSTVAGAGSVIGSRDGASFTHLEIENLTIRVKSKNGLGANIAPEATAVNGSGLNYLTMVSVAIDTESPRALTVEPLPGATGVILPPTNNYVFVNIDKVLVTGFYTAFELYECASLTNIFIDGCYYGLSFNTSNHAAFVSKIFISRTKIDIVVRGEMCFVVEQYGFEASDFGWYSKVYNLQELVPGSQGIIKYNRVTSYVGHDNTVFLKSTYAGSKIKVESIGYSAQTEDFSVQTGDYTISAIDRERTIIFNSATDVELRVPLTTAVGLSVGAKIKAVQNGLGKITVMPRPGVTLNALGNLNITAGQFAALELLKTGINTWLLTGNLSESSGDIGGGGGVNSEVEIFTESAGIVDLDQIDALNALVSGLKTAGVWAKIGVLYPFIGSTASQHSFNLKNAAAHQLVYHGTGAHTSLGYLPNGTDGYADTQFVFSDGGLTQDSAHLGFYGLNNIGESTGIYAGAFEAPTGLLLQPRYTGGGTNYSYVNSLSNHGHITNTDGFYLLNRNNALSDTFDKDGELVSTSNTASNGLATIPAYIGALNRGGTATNFSTEGCGFFSIGQGLTDAEKESYYDIVMTFIASKS